MTAIIANNFRFLNAQSFLDRLDPASVTQNAYLFISKILPWVPDDSSPPMPIDSVDSTNYRVWDDMLALKRITNLTTVHTIPRVDYDNGGNTIYVPFDSTDGDLFNHPTPAEVTAAGILGKLAGNFYVLTDEFNVYECIDNNNGAVSTIKPTGTGTAIFGTGDGYRWKFLYQINGLDLLNYLTGDWMPVKTLTVNDGSPQWAVQQAAVDGSIDFIKVSNQGSGYIFTNNDTAQNGSFNTIILGGSASNVNSVYNNSTIFIVSGTGAGQSRIISSYVGGTKTATVSANWSTIPDNTSVYKILPTISISGDGSGAVGQAVVSAGKITNINILSAGSNYKFAAVSIMGGGGTNASAYPSLSPIGGHGADMVKELGGFFLNMNVTLAYNEGSGDFTTQNDYRKIGVMVDVLNSSSVIATDPTMRATSILGLTGIVGTFDPDEVIISSGSGSPTAQVVQYDNTGPGVGNIYYYHDPASGNAVFSVSETITGQTSGATAVIGSITGPEVKKYTGELIYIEQRRPIMRAPDQQEIINLIIQF